MGFSSQSDLMNQITNNGKSDIIIQQKTLVAAGLAGHFGHFLSSAGSIPAASFGGAEATFIPTDNTWSEGAQPIPDVSLPATKHLLDLGGSLIAAAGAPWFIIPVDLVGYAKLTGTNVSTAGTKTITMTPIGSSGANVDRYPDGAGLRLAVISISTMGANAPTMQINYTNQAGVTGKQTIAGCVSTAAAPNGTILNSGNAANKYGPFLPLAANDSGVKDIESLTWGGTAHASGSVAILLCKPLIGAPIPVPATGLFNLLDLVNSIPALPRLRNGCNLGFLFFQTGATTAGATLYMGGDYAWGG